MYIPPLCLFPLWNANVLLKDSALDLMIRISQVIRPLPRYLEKWDLFGKETGKQKEYLKRKVRGCWAAIGPTSTVLTISGPEVWESCKTPILLLCHLGWGWVQSLDTAFRTSLKSCRLLFPLRLVCSGLPLCQQSSSPCVGDGEITELAAYPSHCHPCPQQGFSAPVTVSTEAACAALLHTCSSYNCEEWPGLCNQE